MDWFKDLFIDEVKPSLEYHSGFGGSGGSSDDTQMYVLVDEDGNEYPAVLVDEEMVFDATANDIREGKIAATDDGVTVGTKDITSYHTLEGFKLIPAGSEFKLTEIKNCEYTELQAIICAYGTNLTSSVSAEKVSIESKVYEVGSNVAISDVTVDVANSTINFGITNEKDKPCVIRYFTYKEEY